MGEYIKSEINDIDETNKIIKRLYDQRKYQQAIVLADKACNLARKRLEKDHPDLATSLNNLAAIYYSLGRYEKAEPLYREAIEIWRKALGEDNPQFANALSSLATLYFSMGRYSDAESFFRRAMEIRRKILGENSSGFAQSLDDLANIYDIMGSYTKAKPLYRQAMAIRRKVLGKDHSDFARSLNNLATIYSSMKRYAIAEPLYRKAMEIWRKAIGEDHPDFAAILTNLAVIYDMRGNYEKAGPLYRQAMQVMQNALGEDHPDLATSLNNMAFYYLSTGSHAKAEPLYRRVLEIRRSNLGENHPDFALSLNNLAGLFAALDREGEAFSLMEKAKSIHDKMIGQIFSFVSEGQRIEYLCLMRNSLNAFFSLVLQLQPLSQEAVQSAMSLVLSRKAILAESQSVQRDAVLGGRYPYLKNKLNELRIVRGQIAQKTLAGPGEEGLATHRKLLSDRESQREQIESELARQIPEMNLREILQQADCRAVRKCLKNVSAILVEFIRYDLFDFKAVPSCGEKQWKPARYLAFVLTAKKPDEVHMIDLGEAEHTDSLVARFRTAIADNSTKEASNQIPPSIALIGEQLRKAIFDPVKEVLGNHKRLIISPDGDLSQVPFEALPNDCGGFLIDDYQFSYVAVGRDVLRFNRESFAESSPPVVVADPDFNLGGRPRLTGKKTTFNRHSRDLDRSGFARLLETRDEGEYLAAKFGVTPWLGSSALEKPLKAVRSPNVLHIATHGFFHEDQKQDPNGGTRGLEFTTIGAIDRGGRFSMSNLGNPLLRSGLALAGANTWLKGQDPPEEAEDGLLTAEDVTGMDLLDTELVVLSACDTGLGEVHIGEGVMGLRRSFMLAGAKTLVMSLWKVPNDETRELMEDFYSRLIDGTPRAEALRQAQLALKAKYPNPYFWGAFICQGDPSPIEAFKKPK